MAPLRNEGFIAASAFADDREQLLDVELWETGKREDRLHEIAEIQKRLDDFGAEVTDRYVGDTFSVLRISARGNAIRWLLELPSVRVIDLPPQIDTEVEQLLETTIHDLPSIEAPDADAPIIGIIDSGVNDAHPLLASVVVERFAAPASLGLSDDYGHGTKVSGVAAYGDLRACLTQGLFKAPVRLMSGKVVNGRGQFDDRRLIATQMTEVVQALHARGCRIFNVSLGDRSRVFDGGKVGTWTAVLDDLARKLNVLFVVSAGNYEHTPENPEELLTRYPHYLLEPASRIVEPATAANVLSVGAVASPVAVGERLAGDAALRPIAQMGEPAPFTRSGLGISNAIKPDLCDDGGNQFFGGVTQRVQGRPQCEILTTFPKYLERLFTTAFGTSYSAPLVAHKAALVLRAIPGASANLLRALLVSSARVPPAASDRIEPLEKDSVPRLYGFGVPNATEASTSEPDRVVLYADDEIGMDRVLIYEVPVPAAFAETKGKRSVRVTLAFDPPTRHTRAAYLGVEMSFCLVRGRSLEQVHEFYRKRNATVEGRHPDLGPRYNCKFDIGPRTRERGTLQSATFTMASNPAAEYGDTYYLVVRCERQWFPDEYAMQRFAVVVEMRHDEKIELYELVRIRVQADRLRSQA